MKSIADQKNETSSFNGTDEDLYSEEYESNGEEMNGDRDGNICASPQEKMPVLSAEEEKELFLRKAAGDSEAREILIRSNMGLVLNIAMKYLDEKVSLDDLVQSGVIGLITAVDRYDISFGSRLSTYAVRFIRGEIARYKKNALLPVRIPYSIDYRYRLAKKILSQEDSTVTEENIQKIAELMHMDKWYVLNIICANREPLEFRKNMLDDICEEGWNDEDTGYGNPFPILQSSETNEELERFMQYLPLRQRVAVRLRYGYLDGVEHTFEEIGKELSCNRRRAYQIVAEGQEMLSLLMTDNMKC